MAKGGYRGGMPMGGGVSMCAVPQSAFPADVLFF